MDDLAHSLRFSWLSLGDLQNLVTQGKFGSKPGVLKPFDKLKKAELKEELVKWGVLNITRDKKRLESTLVSILKGAQRVPTLLITDPTQSLSELNLSSYTILDSEPLHDLKGHLINLLTELPEGSVKSLCLDLLNNLLFSKKQNGYSGRDL